MDDSAANVQGRGRNKRYWTSDEDMALVTALSELATDSHWKCENGFRNGYMLRLEELIGKALPGRGLKAIPHIDSRIKTLVTKFRAFAQMLGTSGFKWDDEKHKISVEKTVYDEYCKVHPNCKNLYGISFPHFYPLMEIYGKDYATGKPAEGFVEAVDNMQNTTPAQVNVDSSDDEEEANGNGTQACESAPSSKRLKREKNLKRKGTSLEGDGALDNVQVAMKEMSAHLSIMASAMSDSVAIEKEEAGKKKKVMKELLALEGLTPAEAIDAANILTAEPNKLGNYFECPDDLKVFFVKRLFHH